MSTLLPTATHRPNSQLPDIIGEMVAVQVGQKTFHIHDSVLVSSSKYFQNAIKPEWRTDAKRPIDLADANPVLFEKYSQWLYTKQTPLVGIDKYRYLARLDVFSEQIMDESFQKAILLAIIAKMNVTKPGIDTIRIIFDGTTTNSPARRLMVDSCAFTLTPSAKRIKLLNVDRDGEFMMDLIGALVKHRNKPSTACPWKSKPFSHYFRTKKSQQTGLRIRMQWISRTFK